MKNPAYSRRRVNFIPLELRPAAIGPKLIAAAVLVAVLWAPLAASGVRVARIAAERRLAEAVKRQEELAAELQARIQARDASVERLASTAVKKALAEKLYWADVFKELSNVAPKSLWLTDFQTSVEEKEGKKVVISGMGASQPEIAEFFARLERSYFYRFVEMKFTELTEVTGSALYRFQFEGKVYDEPAADAARRGQAKREPAEGRRGE